jgi:pimeloyl-[acyl-carrier protein] methyl ester esterase
MKLYTQTSGTGPDLVLIHGWGLHGGVWDELLPLLEKDFRVTRVDLPGHGRSDWQDQVTLDRMVASVLDAVPAAAAWLGWSLGGLVATRAALLAPGRVNALIIVAGTPCFIRKPDWQSAMLPALLDDFACDLQHDYQRTLNRFLALQVRGSEDPAGVLRTLRDRLFGRGEPHPAALRAGLAILQGTDLRAALPAVGCPVMLLMGQRDTLVPATAGDAAVRLFPDAHLQVIEGAGHAPFIAAPERVAGHIQTFLQPPGVAQTGEGHA